MNMTKTIRSALLLFGLTERSVSSPDNPRNDREDGKDRKLHAEQADGAEDALLEPPAPSWRSAVVAPLKGLSRVRQNRVLSQAVDDLEQDNEDRNANGRLSMFLCDSAGTNDGTNWPIQSIGRLHRLRKLSLFEGG